LKSIALLGLHEEAPSQMKAYVNREDVDFDTVESMQADQEWDLVRDVPRDTLPEYPTKITKFSTLRNLTLFFPANFAGSDVTKITYIGLKGEWMALNKDPIITIYEAAANPADHKTPTAESMTNSHSIQ
jgi:hypothetical protein